MIVPDPSVLIGCLQKEMIELRLTIPEVQDAISKAEVALEDYRADRREPEATKARNAIAAGRAQVKALRAKIKENKRQIAALKELN